VEVAAQRIEEELETTPQALLARLDADPETMPEAEALEHEIARLRRARDALGSVNLRAEEDARELQSEHDTAGPRARRSGGGGGQAARRDRRA
jgi:chromosome segregation protein